MIARFRPALRGLLLAAFCLALVTPAHAQRREDPKALTKSDPKLLAAFRKVVAEARDSTVRVRCDGKDVAYGTVVGADGWVLTKASELKANPTCKLRDGRELPGQVIGVQEAFDLALLKIDARGLRPVEWRPSREAPVGNWVAVPGLTDDPVAVGVVSVAARSGGPREAPPRDPASAGFLGVRLEPIDEGIKVVEVVKDGPAEKAGLKADDIVLALNGKAVQDVESFIEQIQRHKVGDIVKVKIKRGSEEKEIAATLARRPASGSFNRGDFQNRLGGELSNRRTGFPSFFQHDTALKPSDCGGPVVDLDGKVIGINIARAGRTESYALPSEAVVPLMYDLMSGKLAPKPVTGKAPTPAEMLAQAKAELARLEAEKAALEKKVAEARAAVARAEAEVKKGERKVPGVLNFKMKGLDGKEIDLASYQGKVVLIVNVASQCGYTPQYKGLQALHDKYAGQGLVVLGVPSNDFGGQEPGSNADIAQFCEKNYGVKFPMLAKVTVKGAGQVPLYKYLTAKETNPKFAGEVKWNFTKFLISRSGEIVGRFEPAVEPGSAELTKAIEAELAKK